MLHRDAAYLLILTCYMQFLLYTLTYTQFTRKGTMLGAMMVMIPAMMSMNRQ